MYGDEDGENEQDEYGEEEIEEPPAPVKKPTIPSEKPTLLSKSDSNESTMGQKIKMAHTFKT
jgi:hypothetical protein